VRQVHLVDGHDDGNAGGFGVVDRLLGLRHDAVVGGDHDDGDVRHVGPAGPHLGEGLLAGGVGGGDRLARVLDPPGADYLRDAARFGGHDVAGADLVEQRGLAAVDLAHDGNDRGPRLQVLGGVGLLEGGEELLLGVGRALDVQLAAAFEGEHFRHLRVDIGVNVGLHAQVVQLEEHVPVTHADGLAQRADRDRQRHGDLALARLRAGLLFQLGPLDVGVARRFLVEQGGGAAALTFAALAALDILLGALGVTAFAAGNAAGPDLGLAAFVAFVLPF